MEFIKTTLKDAYVIKPQVFGDNRGWFTESYNKQKYLALGIDNNFIQDNYNFNGLHKDENIDAHKYGGAVLVDLEGNSLIQGKIGKL